MGDRKAILSANPKAKGLIFDLDGTLIDSMPLHWKAWQQAFRLQGVELEYDEFIQYAGKPIEKIAVMLIEHYGMKVAPEVIVAEKQRVVWENISDVKHIDAVVKVAKENHGKLPMAVGTGSDRKRALHMLEGAGLLDLFDVIVCAEDVENHKPHPDTFLECARQMGVAPEECEVFEDSIPGLKAATDGGMIATDVKPYY